MFPEMVVNTLIVYGKTEFEEQLSNFFVLRFALQYLKLYFTCKNITASNVSILSGCVRETNEVQTLYPLEYQIQNKFSLQI